MNETNNILALMRIALRVDIPVFKQFRGYCDKWMEGTNPLMRRAGYLALLFLIQGRGQVVKGDVPRIVNLVTSNLPKSVEDLKEMEVNDVVAIQTAETGELNLYSREDGKKIDTLVRSNAVGDEEVSENTECSLYGACMNSSSRYIDWYVLVLLLVELYSHFPGPVHDCVRDSSALLNEVSVLLASQHLYTRVEAMQFFQEYFEKEFIRASLCDSTWISQPGSLFFVLQRLLIMFHIPHSLQSLSLQSDLLSMLLCACSEYSIPAPEGLKNTGLPPVHKEEGVLKRLQAINSVRQLYSLDDIENEDEESESENEESENEENESEEEEENESDERKNEENSDESELSEQNEENRMDKRSKSPRPLKTMRRIPNPYRVIDALYLLGSILNLNDMNIKKSVLTIFETICAFFTPDQIQENIVILNRLINFRFLFFVL